MIYITWTTRFYSQSISLTEINKIEFLFFILLGKEYDITVLREFRNGKFNNNYNIFIIKLNIFANYKYEKQSWK
jgi:hypothetical protein